MLSRPEPADMELLARHLAKRISLQGSEPELLKALQQDLPAHYQPILDELYNQTRQSGALALALLLQQNDSLRQLGTLLQQYSEQHSKSAELTHALNDWLQRRARLQRVGAQVEQAVCNQLFYFVTLLTVFSTVCLTWLSFVAPTYAELFAELSGNTATTSLSHVLVGLATSEHLLAKSLPVLFGLLPLLALLVAALVKRELVRLRRGSRPSAKLKRLPGMANLAALHELLNPDSTTIDWQQQPLLSSSERLGLQLASKGQYLADELALLQALPEAVLAERVSAPLRRITTGLTLALWICIALFLVAAYQPIFSLGAHV